MKALRKTLVFCLFFTVMFAPRSHVIARESDSFLNSKPSESIELNSLIKNKKRGLGYGLTIGGAVVTSLGIALEAAALGTFYGLDEGARIQYGSESGLFTYLHVTSGVLLTTGLSTLLSGIAYVDDSAGSKQQWKKVQVIMGSVFLSLGSAAAITGGILYGVTDFTNEGIGVMGGGAPLVISGIVNLFVGLFAP